MTDAKEIVADFFTTFSRGDVEEILDKMTDDATWWVAGNIKGMSGINSKAELGELLRQVKPIYRLGALAITPISMIAEGDKVAVEAKSFAELTNGCIYANEYHFLIKVKDGKICRVREYSDTQHMLQTFS